MERSPNLDPVNYGFRRIGKPEHIESLSWTDIWRAKFEGKRIILDPSLFSDQK